ncbi:MAG: hypothetical protein KAR24_00875 [Candidatus Pacebacteria bacterium]|nr:hypothetical protein [Candidatus Paceibacterota bacterium]
MDMGKNFLNSLLKINGPRSRSYEDIDPDEIFLDSSNLPQFDVYQFEGRIVRSLSKTTIMFLGMFFVLVTIIFLCRIGLLQIVKGQEYVEISENNRLAHTFLFPERGVIFDCNDEVLAWNIPGISEDFTTRAYIATSGLSHVLGYVKYPQADSSGVYYKTEYSGVAGIEKQYNVELNGVNGVKLVERNALLEVESENIINPPEDGEDLTLTIDTRVQTQMYKFIKDLSYEKGFKGGTGIIMNIHSGEILALTNYPEYNSSVISAGEDAETIAGYSLNEGKPYLNRAISGRYTPGSIVKPFVALGALNEGVISPDKKILSTGKLVIPNPWNPEFNTIFTDWRAHGYVDIRDALAVSSNIYFYEVGGGFEPDDQEGIGIANIERYARMFGIGEITGVDIPGEVDGVIPNPAWKEINFDGEEWRIGDTYNTAIGQYGFQVTPIQMVRAIAAIASNGALVVPHVVKQDIPTEEITVISDVHYTTVKEGLRQAVTDGTAKGLYLPYIKVAAKTGTAEVGISKSRVNSWAIGYFPYDDPQYAFTVMMEEGPRENTIGGLYIMRQVFDWMNIYTPEYFD